MAGQLVLDPTGAATTLTLGSTSAVERIAVEYQVARPRATHVGTGGTAQTDAAAVAELPRGTLRIRTTAAERTTVHGWITQASGLLDGETLRARYTVGGAYWDLVLDGERIDERWEPLVLPQLWRLDLPVVVTGSG